MPPPKTLGVSLRVEYHDGAKVDVVEAWAWYEDRKSGLGDRFLGAVRVAVRRATQWPTSGTPVKRDDAGEVVERRSGLRAVASRCPGWDLNPHDLAVRRVKLDKDRPSRDLLSATYALIWMFSPASPWQLFQFHRVPACHVHISCTSDSALRGAAIAEQMAVLADRPG